MLGLGIESSCDETSVAIVRNGSEALANEVFSQVAEHAPFGGVVPEIASRAHLEKINAVYADALAQAGVTAESLDYVAVSVQPGLIGSLLIGAQFAKCLALVHNLPTVLVDHVEAHLYAPCLEGWVPEYPFLGLLLSGGNSAIFRVAGPLQLDRIADTLDDACGEAFDKAAAILGLGFPGGPAVEACAADYAERVARGETPLQESLFGKLLRKLADDELAFSFSGVKTAVLRAAREGLDPGRICFDFQGVVFELIERNLRTAVRRTGIRRVVASGGVLANGALRKRLEAVALESDFALVYPRRKLLCTDNAGMVAALGARLLQTPRTVRSLDFRVSSKRYLPGESD